MAHAFLSRLDDLDGPALKDRFAEVRKAAVSAGAQVEADAATRILHQHMRSAVRAMVKGIDARVNAPVAPAATAAIPDPRIRSPMRPVAPPRPPVPTPAARAAAPKPSVPPRSPPLPVGPPAIDEGDDAIPW